MYCLLQYENTIMVPAISPLFTELIALIKM